MRTFVALLVSTVSAAGVVSAQPVLSCDSRTVLVRDGTPILVRYRPGPKRRAALENGPQWRFGGFDPAKFDFERVDFYVDATGPFDGGLYGDYGPIDVFVRLRGETDHWFQLVPAKDRFGYDSPETLQGHKNSHTDRRIIGLATPDPHLPLFVVTLGEETGRGPSSWLHVVDLRPRRKRVPASINCYSPENQGGCGTWSSVYGGEEVNATCEWKESSADFLCDMSAGIDTTWGGDRTTAWQELLIGNSRLRPTSIERSIRELAQAEPDTTGPGRAVETAHWGTAQVILRRSAPDGSSVTLVGVAGQRSSFDAQFRLVEIDSRGRATAHNVGEVPLGPSYWQEFKASHDEVVTLEGRPVDRTLSMNARVVFERAGLLIAEVHIREGRESEVSGGLGVGQALYWIGIEKAGTQLRGSALRLATDTYEYFHCASAATPPSVFAWTLEESDAFRADIEIEPPHQVNLWSGTPQTDSHRQLDLRAPACPTRATVIWRDGFRIAHATDSPACGEKTPARFVCISNAGAIHAVDRPVVGEHDEAPPVGDCGSPRRIPQH